MQQTKPDTPRGGCRRPPGGGSLLREAFSLCPRRELILGAAEPGLDAAQGLVLAEAMGNGDDEWLRHCGVFS